MHTVWFASENVINLYWFSLGTVKKSGTFLIIMKRSDTTLCGHSNSITSLAIVVT